MHLFNNDFTNEKVAVLYQAIQAPVIDGIRKPMKPGGYSDSGSDIAFNLQHMQVDVATPSQHPHQEQPFDWIYPDSLDGIKSAIQNGANVLWANTILFKEHPLAFFSKAKIKIVGQIPADVQRFDDKWFTNELLRAHNLTVAPACLVTALEDGPQTRKKCLALADLSQAKLNEFELQFPLVVKPVRGRGSQGVKVVNDLHALATYAQQLLAQKETFAGEVYTKYGLFLMLEQYMPGVEITITVMPPGVYYNNDGTPTLHDEYWALPVVKRFNHAEGIAPYSGVVAVAENSALLTSQEKNDLRYARVQAECVRAAKLIKAHAPIRIDCREGVDKRFYLFDLNMKPNMTGPGRLGRDNQENLTAIAASDAPLHWNYPLLLINILKQAWPATEMMRAE